MWLEPLGSSSSGASSTTNLRSISTPETRGVIALARRRLRAEALLQIARIAPVLGGGAKQPGPEAVPAERHRRGAGVGERAVPGAGAVLLEVELVRHGLEDSPGAAPPNEGRRAVAGRRATEETRRPWPRKSQS